MTPEISKLNWSTERPTFEEVNGKNVIVQYNFDFSVVTWGAQHNINQYAKYEMMFGEHFYRYAIFEVPPVSPLPLWGKLPIFRKTLLEDYFWAWTDEVTSFSKRGFQDEQAATVDWNSFVNKVEQK